MAKKPLTRKKIIQKDIGNYSMLEAVKSSEGGKLILNSLKRDILATIDAIAGKYKDATHAELIALSARLSERITLFRLISRSSTNKKLALEELELILAEPEENEE